MKTLLILTGPQGTGNHMWSKIFALHPQVMGWRELLKTYWIGHDQEPFADCWVNPDLLKDYDWSQSDYYVTSVSAPYMSNGQRVIPDIVRFAATAMGQGLVVKIAIIGRDQNIIKYQQNRVRKATTYELALAEYKKLVTWKPQYLSYELLHLFGSAYLQQLSNNLEFPIDYNNNELKNILEEDTNSKYFQPVGHYRTDDLAHASSRRWK